MSQDKQPVPLPTTNVTGLGDEYDSFDRNGRSMGKAYANIDYFTADQMREYGAACAAAALEAAEQEQGEPVDVMAAYRRLMSHPATAEQPVIVPDDPEGMRSDMKRFHRSESQSAPVAHKLAAALKKLLALCEANPAMQGREYIGVGIAVNDALHAYERQQTAAPEAPEPQAVVKSVRAREMADEVLDELAELDAIGGWSETAIDRVQSNLLPRVYDCLNLLSMGAPQPPATEAGLTKPAKVGNGIFREGVPERLVIEAAQRQYEYTQTPEGLAEREAEKERGSAFLAELQSCGKPAQAEHQPTEPDGYRWRFKEGKDRTWRYVERMPGFDPNIVESEPLVLAKDVKLAGGLAA